MTLLPSNQHAFTKSPAKVICIHCQAIITSKIKLECSAIIPFACLCTLGLSWCAETWYNHIHYCGECGRNIGYCDADSKVRKKMYHEIIKREGLDVEI